MDRRFDADDVRPAAMSQDPLQRMTDMPTPTSSQPARWHVPFWSTAVRRLRGFAESCRGAVAIEFAMVVPLMVLLVLGGVDMGRYALVYQKAQRTAATVADLLAGEPILTDASIDSVLAASTHVMRPFPVGDNARVIGSMLTLQTDSSGGFDSATVVDWQRCWVAPGYTGLAANSSYGTSGNSPTAYPPGFQVLPANTTVTIMVAEVVYQHQYLFMDFLGDETPVHVTAVYLPRSSSSTAGLSITDNC